MRIISGKLKGRRLAPPADRSVRPTSDKVKEAIFSMIAEYMGEDTVCADVFSGTGNLGLEAISRGAGTVYYGDRSRESIALTRENITHCRAEDQAVVIPGEYTHMLSRLREKVDIFFLDPPYGDGLLLNCMDIIAQRGLLSEEGIIVAEHDAKDQMPDKLPGLRKIKHKKYGSIGVSVYEGADR